MIFSKEDTKAIKGVSIILMLYHHLFAFPDRIANDIVYFSTLDMAGNSISYWIGVFGKLCVALYLFLGGYGTYLSCNKSTDISKVITCKIKQLYIAYWKVFFIFIPICMLAGVQRVTINLQEWIWNFTGLKISYCGEWWFFTPYVALLFIYPIIHKFISEESNLYTDLFIVLFVKMVISYIFPNMYTYVWASQLSNSLFWNIFSTMLSCLPAFLMGCIFAKYDLISKAKQYYEGKKIGYFGSFLVIFLLFYMRKQTGNQFDYLFAAIFTVALSILFECKICKIFKHFLIKIGNESTTIWLVHSIYCYLLCQHLIYLPQYTVLIFLWLLILTYLTAILMKKFYARINRITVFICKNKCF